MHMDMDMRMDHVHSRRPRCGTAANTDHTRLPMYR